VGVALNSYSLSLGKRASERRELAEQGAQYLIRIDGLVYAVVSESRGIYMSPDLKTAEPYNALLLKRLEEIEQTVALWKDHPVESERSKVEELDRGDFAVCRISSRAGPSLTDRGDTGGARIWRQ
jgi:hypothetical protein